MKNLISKILKEELLKEGKRVKLGDSLLSTIDLIIDKWIPQYLSNVRAHTTSILSRNDFLASGTDYEGSKVWLLGTVKYNELGSKEQSSARIWVTSSTHYRWSGLYVGNDNKNKNDNSIMLNLQNFDIESYKEKKEFYRDVLTHEFTHAVDPSINYHTTKKTFQNYDTNAKGIEWWKKYVTHDIEVIAQSTTFFNGIVKNTKLLVSKNDEDILDDLEKALNNLVQAFATSNYDLIHTTEFNSLMRGVVPNGFVNFLDKANRFVEKNFMNPPQEKNDLTHLNYFLGKNEKRSNFINYRNKDNKRIVGDRADEFWVNWERIIYYKMFNPKAWKSFLTKLYNTVEECKEIINNKRKELSNK